MNCLHCQKIINEKPWNHLTNILDMDKEGNEIYTDKYICGYICYRRLSETNKLPKNLWSHLVNKEDYKGLISPVISKNKEMFQYLTHSEIQGMDIDERDKYYSEKEDQLIFDPICKEVREEMEREDMRTAEIENDLLNYSDDY